MLLNLSASFNIYVDLLFVRRGVNLSIVARCRSVKNAHLRVKSADMVFDCCQNTIVEHGHLLIHVSDKRVVLCGRRDEITTIEHESIILTYLLCQCGIMYSCREWERDSRISGFLYDATEIHYERKFLGYFQILVVKLHGTCLILCTFVFKIDGVMSYFELRHLIFHFAKFLTDGSKTLSNKLVGRYNNLIAVCHPVFIVYCNQCVQNIITTLNVDIRE